MGEEEAAHQFPLLEAIFFALIEEICLRAPQIDSLWTTICIFLLGSALLAIIGIGDCRASPQVTQCPDRTTVTLITYVHIAVTDHALAITFFT